MSSKIRSEVEGAKNFSYYSYPSEFRIHNTSCILVSDLSERLKENLVYLAHQGES